MAKQLTIVVVESRTERARSIRESLEKIGDYRVVVVDDSAVLSRSIAEIRPDVVLLDMENPTRDALEECAQVTGPLERPVAMFVDQSGEGLAKSAIEAGLSAYVVDGLRPERLKPIIEAAIARFQMFQRVRKELEATKLALEERKIIDRAKGILMKARGLTEEEAYALLRKTAMDQGRKVFDVAEALVTAAGLLA
ncbi:ANTAR domain-containing response regulator [Loktanella agnita]|uniref:ANTAR domain-containing response regulator n=1 Tax=Loktanella agnita TaxID=287097 RepID=UPI0039874AEE